MRRAHDPAPHSAADWQSRSRACLAAAAQLSSAPELAWPRLQLLRLALECCLKGVIASRRGGAPESRDLGRLVTLARHCGLRPAERDSATLVAIAACADGRAEAPGGWPDVIEVEKICARLSAAD